MDIAPIPRPLIWPTGLCALAFAGLVGLASGSVVPLYYPILLGLGALGWQRREAVKRLADRVALPVSVKLILAGYLGVIGEETLAGVLHGLSEGGSPARLAEAAGQFIAFNLFAFTGIILSLTIWRQRLAFGRWDLFLAAGAWGLFAEGSLQALIGNPVAGALLLLPNMGVYAVILWPLVLICPGPAQGTRKRPLRLLLIWATAFALSLPPILALGALRAAHPTWFPACSYIAC